MTHAHNNFAEMAQAYVRDQGSTSRMKIDHLRAQDWSDDRYARARAGIVDVGGSLGHAATALHNLTTLTFSRWVLDLPWQPSPRTPSSAFYLASHHITQ